MKQTTKHILLAALAFCILFVVFQLVGNTLLVTTLGTARYTRLEKLIMLTPSVPSKPAVTNATAPLPSQNATTPHVAQTLLPTPSPSTLTPSPLTWDTLVTRLEKDGFDAKTTRAAFDRLHSPPLPFFMAQKIVEIARLNGNLQAAVSLDGLDPDAFALPDYKAVGGMSTQAAYGIIKRNEKMFANIYKRYGVPSPFIIAILMVETGMGGNLGKQPALLALGSMVVVDSIELAAPILNNVDSTNQQLQAVTKDKSDWAYNELKALLTYAADMEKDPAQIPGSVYGAIGLCQFMPSNIPIYGVSTSGKKSTDLFAFADASYSIANYLASNGWRRAQTPEAQVRVLRSYNHSDIYASTVYGVALQIISPSTPTGAKSSPLQTARKNAAAAIPPRKGKKGAGPPLKLNNYSDVMP